MALLSTGVESRFSAGSHVEESEPGIAFNGTSLSADYASHISRHDLVYHAPPNAEAAMPMGDGDLGATFWCPNSLHWQVQKSDLWDDPSIANVSPSQTPESAWRLLSAGGVSIKTDPALLQGMHRYEQRLSLYSGNISVMADSPAGSCQVNMFVSATHNVIVINYQDQTLRNTTRSVDIEMWREGAYPFAVGDSVGILQGMRDRRYAMVARVEGRSANARMINSHTARLEIAPGRSCHFTLYIAVATCPKLGDPVSIAKGKLQAAMAQGYEVLLREQKQHWAAFWQKSFIRLQSSVDPMAGYLESLWHLNIYSMACCSRGYDAPLASGGLWLNNKDSRQSPALYKGTDLRAMLAPMLPSNHLELSVPTVDSYFRMLPAVAAHTGQQRGVSGAHFPVRFNRFGHSFSKASEDEPVDTNDGLRSALLIWEAWRYGPDPFFLRERAYPTLKAATQSALEERVKLGDAWRGEEDTALAAALRALLWASEEIETDQELRSIWQAGLNTIGVATVYRPECLLPFPELRSADAAARLRGWLMELPQTPQGWFAPDKAEPDLTISGKLCATVCSMLIQQDPLPTLNAINRADFGGMHPTAIKVFPALPSGWDGALSLSTPGGFRVISEAKGGKPLYVAVRSLLGGVCRLINPWSLGSLVRVQHGRQRILETTHSLLEWPTEKGAIYLIESEEFPLSRTVRVRIGGKKNTECKQLGQHTLGLQSRFSMSAPTLQNSVQMRSRLDR